MLYRLFPSLPGAGVAEPGGPLFVPRLDQGRGRHDNADAYGALYLSRAPESTVAELLRQFAGRTVRPRSLLQEGWPMALAALDDSALDGLLYLDDPRNLVARRLRPSTVATRDRERTQPLALSIHSDGAPGFEWWSTIEAAWINVTLFAERASNRLRLAEQPEPITVDHPTVRAAAEAVGVLLP